MKKTPPPVAGQKKLEISASVFVRDLKWHKKTMENLSAKGDNLMHRRLHLLYRAVIGYVRSKISRCFAADLRAGRPKMNWTMWKEWSGMTNPIWCCDVMTLAKVIFYFLSSTV